MKYTAWYVAPLITSVIERKIYFNVTVRYIIHFTLFPIDLTSGIIPPRLFWHGYDRSRKLYTDVIFPHDGTPVSANARLRHFCVPLVVVQPFGSELSLATTIIPAKIYRLIRKIKEIARAVAKLTSFKKVSFSSRPFPRPDWKFRRDDAGWLD